MYRSTKDDVVYVWEIEPFDHIIEEWIRSPEVQFSALNDGFWQVVLYPSKVVNGKEYVQCGLRKVPVHTGHQDTTVRFRFELRSGDKTMNTMLGPRRGEFPRDNDVGFNVICRDDLFRDRQRTIDPVKLVISCYIRKLGREKHVRNLTLNARTEIVTQRVTDMIRVPRMSKHVCKEIEVSKAQKQDGFEQLSIGSIDVTNDPTWNDAKVSIVSASNCYPCAISCRVTLLDTKGNEFKKTEKETRFFVSDQEEWSLPTLVLNTELDDKGNNLLDHNHRYVLYFDMEISLGEFNHSQDKIPTSRLHFPACGVTLAEELGKGYESKKYCDFAVGAASEPDREPIQVHKCILASRSKYFEAMFRDELQENNSAKILLHEVDHDTLETLIRFLYNDYIDFVDKESGEDMDYEIVVPIYKAAHMFLVPGLQADCSSFLKVNIIEENASYLECLGGLFNDADLIKAATDFKSNCQGDCPPYPEEPGQTNDIPKRRSARNAGESSSEST